MSAGPVRYGEGRVTHRGRYLSYTASGAWKARKAKALARAGYRCESCGRGDVPLEVHHWSYERLGHEEDGDLDVLCHPCHDRIHGRRVKS